MTHWNHRVVKKEYPESAEAYTEYSIREVFYNEDGSIYAYTENPMETCEGSLEELREYLMRCLKALDKPILVDGEVIFNDAGDDRNEKFGPFSSMEELKKALEEEDEEWEDKDEIN
jgi:hypothetical protein